MSIPNLNFMQRVALCILVGLTLWLIVDGRLEGISLTLSLVIQAGLLILILSKNRNAECQSNERLIVKLSREVRNVIILIIVSVISISIAVFCVISRQNMLLKVDELQAQLTEANNRLTMFGFQPVNEYDKIFDEMYGKKPSTLPQYLK